ncbi:small nuclear ribonucleoprotein E-like [Haliaeetus albicilla]|uniref:small nuclear ribonucleoprotein E-like n=1 Tax=Haliaeetus albicilla TaxID=8969 RepID=UPI0037E972A1
MAYRGQGQKVQKVMVQPINLIFRYLQNRSRIQVWLYEQVNMRLEGCIIGFDEYMNLVPDDAEEIRSKPKSRKELAGVAEGVQSNSCQLRLTQVALNNSDTSCVISESKQGTT